MAGTSFENRRGTAQVWATANPVLKAGEFGVETDTGVVKCGDGVNNWNALQPILGSTYLPKLGKAADSDKLDGHDSTEFLFTTDAATTYLSKTAAAAAYTPLTSGSAALSPNSWVKRDANNAFSAAQITGLSSPTQDDSAANRKFVNDLVLPAGVNRSLVNHLGGLTAFPASTTGLKIGDRCWRSDLICEFYWNGGVWRQTFAARWTSSQRANLSTASKADLYPGFQIFETDTLFDREWDGTYWEIIGYRGTSRTTGAGMPQAVWSSTSPSVASGATVNFTGAGTSLNAGGTPYATAGDTGGPLFTAPGVADGLLQVNAKGRVLAELYANSDNGNGGYSIVSIQGPRQGFWTNRQDERQRATGYGGCGTLCQWVMGEYYVQPGDRFGIVVGQGTANASATTYSLSLTLTYL